MPHSPLQRNALHRAIFDGYDQAVTNTQELKHTAQALNTIGMRELATEPFSLATSYEETPRATRDAYAT